MNSWASSQWVSNHSCFELNTVPNITVLRVLSACLFLIRIAQLSYLGLLHVASTVQATDSQLPTVTAAAQCCERVSNERQLQLFRLWFLLRDPRRQVKKSGLSSVCTSLLEKELHLYRKHFPICETKILWKHWARATRASCSTESAKTCSIFGFQPSSVLQNEQ